MEQEQKRKGIFFILLSALCFACMSTCVRLAGSVPTFQKSFFRNIVSLTVAVVMLVKDGGGFRPVSKSNWPYLLARATCGTIGLLCNFYAVDHLLLADATMLNKMSPFFAVLGSYFLLKEKLTPVQIGTLVGAFTGVLFIVRPTPGNMDLFPALIGLIGGLCAGLAYTFVRMLGQRGERSAFIVFFFSAFSCLVVLPSVVMNYQPIAPSQLAALLLAGLFAAGGQFSITAAYTHAPAREISVYDYSQVIFSAVLGFFLFGDRPDGWSYVGYAIICGMAVFSFLYNDRSTAK